MLVIEMLSTVAIVIISSFEFAVTEKKMIKTNNIFFFFFSVNLKNQTNQVQQAIQMVSVQ